MCKCDPDTKFKVMGPIYWCPNCNDHFDISEMPKSSSAISTMPTKAPKSSTGSTTLKKPKKPTRARGRSGRGLNVCITGKLPSGKTRDQMVSLLAQNGHTFHKTVKSTTHVLIREENHLRSKSSKTQTAESLGILILSEKEFNEEYTS